MKHSLTILAILAFISVTMRCITSSPVPDEAPLPARIPQPKPVSQAKTDDDWDCLLTSHSTTTITARNASKGAQTFRCDFDDPMEPLYKKTGPYHSSKELRDDLDHKELWIRKILITPAVQRGGKFTGLMISYRSPNPFARLGLQSGDILVSVNGVPTNRVMSFPPWICELNSSTSLHLQVERKGVLRSINVELR